MLLCVVFERICVLWCCRFHWWVSRHSAHERLVDYHRHDPRVHHMEEVSSHYVLFAGELHTRWTALPDKRTQDRTPPNTADTAIDFRYISDSTSVSTGCLPRVIPPGTAECTVRPRSIPNSLHATSVALGNRVHAQVSSAQFETIYLMPAPPQVTTKPSSLTNITRVR